MNCPNCQSTKEPKFSRELPMTYFCPDCGEDTEDDPEPPTMSLADAHAARYITVRAAVEDLLAELAHYPVSAMIEEKITAVKKALTDTWP